ncbi:urea ABC transporter permease subunit UrtB [Tropicibacter oceani]|uniref:Urea ABC transporter permease subunit UrtB n=1 Tax=Tropicibacter oceani TaxID=3058420 RepID=A0ABY8QMB1_9RHOB|nr:urea ABC transporter permease subunit UrtB [Tropicibacter oceani]WGW05146.1 urea ABC transporter permease subunit UrtB [Tropicibacter oceani]
MLRALIAFCLLVLTGLSSPAAAQDLQTLLQTHADEVAKPGRQSVDVVIDDLMASGLPQVQEFLERWQAREVVQDEATGLFYYADPLTDIDSGQPVTLTDASLSAIKPNGGVRKVIGGALVQFQLSDPDIAKRTEALNAIARAPSGDQIEPLEASLQGETDAALLARKQGVVDMLKARYGETTEVRVAAIENLAGGVSVEARATLNQILATTAGVARDLPQGVNIARVLTLGKDLTEAEAFGRLVDAGLTPARISNAAIKEALAAHIDGGAVAGIPVHDLGTLDRRFEAYARLADQGLVPPTVTDDQAAATMAQYQFYETYAEPDAEVTAAALRVLDSIERSVAINQTADLALDAISLASIYFLAAIGLAIIFGVMGVINMAHGEFIMMGAYTGYVMQQIIPDYTLSLVVALPVAFAVTFGAGVAMERLVIRHLYHRPLETLLATFGISIALQQLAKNIFGTQARPLTSPGWLDGALVFNEVVQISYIRIAIFVLALIFLGLILFILNKTRLGLEVRAVTQNPGMAASMGINPDRINMLTFGLGSGIAGIAGVAIGLYAKVTSEMGADYIVQSFMTVVVGGVGNVWGTLAGASMIGSLQKGIEFLNPSNTLAAQTYMILFIILFIQFRPKGIVALKGRAAEA